MSHTESDKESESRDLADDATRHPVATASSRPTSAKKDLGRARKNSIGICGRKSDSGHVKRRRRKAQEQMLRSMSGSMLKHLVQVSKAACKQASA
jgi:hypothetical protein